MKRIFFSSVFVLLFFSIYTSSVFAGGVVNAGTVNWPPYYGTDLKDGGFATEITREAFKRTGWEYKLEFMNWNRALGLCEQGKLDFVQGAYYSDERAKKYYLTKGYASVDLVFFTKKGSGITYKNPEDLKDYKIGIIRGFAYPKVITEATYLKTELTDTLETNIRKLLKGRIDLLIGAKIVTLDLVNSKFSDQADQLVALDPPLKKNDLLNVVSKKTDNGQQIVQDFNKGLQMIIDDGTYDKILKKHGF